MCLFILWAVLIQPINFKLVIAQYLYYQVRTCILKQNEYYFENDL